ncbi:Aste57867_5460 [Aphanomyces stellatus]|uniref:Aste57867_4906 protein n=1 Tax=Aphanomyces stellatus TaxID=120398 RepID=A0A485KEJ4_9STRA|nr:hypothetical protein As57867_005447 [Aphanomyces stellatus]KAF0712172.1 hypothetical protein As57867_004893 [Aphanomyces stellatus]VFT81997.1 Aste57867_4906 [Aphanomyces stellatus]VFT82512.1 Aste57867_5460 [Aphanomyces stellatus]
MKQADPDRDSKWLKMVQVKTTVTRMLSVVDEENDDEGRVTQEDERRVDKQTVADAATTSLHDAVSSLDKRRWWWVVTIHRRDASDRLPKRTRLRGTLCDIGIVPMAPQGRPRRVATFEAGAAVVSRLLHEMVSVHHP